jgi:hypothetical protein
MVKNRPDPLWYLQKLYKNEEFCKYCGIKMKSKLIYIVLILNLKEIEDFHLTLGRSDGNSEGRRNR